MNWKLHFLARALYRNIPYNYKIKALLRKTRPPQWREPTEGWALTQALEMISMIQETGGSCRNKRLLEIGTGWFPVAPVVFALSGAASVHTIDIDHCLGIEHLQATVRGLLPHSAKIAEKLGIAEQSIQKKLGGLRYETVDDTLKALDISYFPHHDLRKGAPSKEYDIVYSRAVLEHISENILSALIASIENILVPGGLTVHIIDNSDHWQHCDQSISRINYLALTDLQNTIVNRFNPQDFQNRLRNSEYVTMFQEKGLTLLLDRPEVDPKSLEDLKRVSLHPRFKHMEKEDLAAITSYLVFKKAQGSESATEA